MDKVGTKSEAREQFAQNLRQARIARGYKTARSLARALNIDENRYTRYERAEVEPDLKLLQQMCRLLGVTPNELLLGFGSAPSALDDDLKRPWAAGTSGEGTVLFEALAWRLAAAAVTSGIGIDGVRQMNGATRPAVSGAPALPKLQQTTVLYRRLVSQPMATMSAIAADDGLTRAGAQTAQQIHDLCAKLAHALSDN